MTSYTKKLYERDPDAAEAFHRQDRFEKAQSEALRYGRVPTLACFHSDRAKPVPFGKRSVPPVPHKACSSLCGHPSCSNGCTLAGRE